MAWIRLNLNRLPPVCDWIWRWLVLLWCCIAGKFRPILRYAFSALGWRKNTASSRVEPEVRPEVNVSESGYPEQLRAAELEAEGRNDAVTGEKAAGSNREPFTELPRREEDEEEEFDSDDFRVQTSDEFYCSYDSTWETEESFDRPFKSPKKAAANRSYKFRRFESAARDMQNYRHGYPIKPQRWMRFRSGQPNLDFYLGLSPSIPDGVYISDFHNQWSGQYGPLEYTHTYIQWLFPLQEPGMNDEASPLTKEEVRAFLNSSLAKENLLESYRLMLDFYGIQLCDEKTGEVKRLPNYTDRFSNLNTRSHNNLRITRILKCLGTLGYPHYQAPLVQFFLEETLVHGELPNVKESVLNYFLFAVLDKKERRKLIKFAYLNHDYKDEFVWCPKKIQMMWSEAVQATEMNEWKF